MERFAIVGSSMGGALAIYCARAMREDAGRVVERVVLINPLMQMKMALPRVALAALRALSRAVPRLEVSAKPTDGCDADEDARPDFDDEAQAQCDADALSWNGGVTLRTAVELYDLVGHNAGHRPEDCGMVRLSFETPVLVITGGRDRVISPETAIERVKLAVQAGGKAEHVQFERAGHSLTLQSRREEVFDLVANWRWK
jgi:alpha-beta hydrolase superfamily lysophospholipase